MKPLRRPSTEVPKSLPSSRSAVNDSVRLTACVHGHVQGVGFRWWARSQALELGLVGHVANLAEGQVEVVAEGPRDACERLLAVLRSGETPGQVREVIEQFDEARGGLTDFVER